MSVSRVEIVTDAYAACYSHAFSTEEEEIMGLLIGITEEVTPVGTTPQTVVKIILSMPLVRSDKRKDRVEIPPEMMAEVSSKVDVLANELKDLEGNLKVVGWYHSHPHITSLPSHVDLNTQLNYQRLADSFVGLIFSAFDGTMDASSGSDTVCCFQSRRDATYGSMERVLVPFSVVPSALTSVAPVMQSALATVSSVTRLNVEEEGNAFGQAMRAFEGRGNGDDVYLDRVMNGARFCFAVGAIFQTLHGPLKGAFEFRTLTNPCRVLEAKTYADELEKVLAQEDSA